MLKRQICHIDQNNTVTILYSKECCRDEYTTLICIECQTNAITILHSKEYYKDIQPHFRGCVFTIDTVLPNSQPSGSESKRTEKLSLA